MIRRPPGSTQSRSSAASDVYKRQVLVAAANDVARDAHDPHGRIAGHGAAGHDDVRPLSLIHISEPTRPY